MDKSRHIPTVRAIAAPTGLLASPPPARNVFMLIDDLSGIDFQDLDQFPFFI
jgi:hypothetical protein